MKKYFDEYVKFTDASLLEVVKYSIFERVRRVLQDLTSVLDFSMEKENYKQFDDLLLSIKIEELNLLVKEK
jgi:hypothetical protein